jgi:glycerol-3-phosphate dehydrogenase
MEGIIMNFSNKHRKEIINRLKKEKMDLLVIGGGITGAGIALDATVRGMKTAVVEMQDFAAGTSSRSTKLVHGGLRYLKQFEVKMVAEVGKEREIVYENGPHVTTPQWMLLPIYKGGTFGSFSTGIGLRVYDYLAGVKKSERRKMLSGDETLNKEPLVKRQGLKGGGYYVEYRTDDARLTIEVMKAAVEKGTRAINYSKVENLLYEKGRIIGVLVDDKLTGEKYEIHADKVVNATGPWVDTIRGVDNSKQGKALQLTKGVHLVLDQSRFPLKQAVYFDTPDGRMVFAVPRDAKVYVGTTDTFFDQDAVNPTVTKSDRDYVINAINYMFPTVKVTKDDIESSWAGVRPLILEDGKDPSEISRKDEIWESESGLITIAGGKLTGYRKMAETIVDLLAKKFLEEKDQRYPNCETKHVPISGGNVGGSKEFSTFIIEQVEKGMSMAISKEEAKHLALLYGSNVKTIFDRIEVDRKKAEQYELPLVLFAKLQYALDHEMVATPVDFLYRRTGALLFDIGLVRKHKDKIVKFMDDFFEWSAETKQIMERQLENEIRNATIPIDEQDN